MPEQKTQAPPTNSASQAQTTATTAAVAATNTTNGFAITSLILGIVSLVFCWIWFGGLLPILGIVFGILGIKKGPNGKGMAIAGLVMSIVALVIMAIIAVIVVVAIIAGSASSGTSTY